MATLSHYFKRTRGTQSQPVCHCRFFFSLANFVIRIERWCIVNFCLLSCLPFLLSMKYTQSAHVEIQHNITQYTTQYTVVYLNLKKKN